MCMHELEFCLRITLNNKATGAGYSYYSHQIEKNRDKRLNNEDGHPRKTCVFVFNNNFCIQKQSPEGVL